MKAGVATHTRQKYFQTKAIRRGKEGPSNSTSGGYPKRPQMLAQNHLAVH